jgi:hypothetical protein
MKPVGDHHHGLHSPTPATKISIPFSSGDAALFGKGRHKTWALAALALWSMFAASVTLRWSSGDLTTTFSDASDPVIDDLDPLVRLTSPFPLVAFGSCRYYFRPCSVPSFQCAKVDQILQKRSMKCDALFTPICRFGRIELNRLAKKQNVIVRVESSS